MFYKKVVLKHFEKITGKYLFRPAPMQAFCCQFCKNFKKNFYWKISGGCFLQMLPNLKKRRKEHTQFKNELNTR